jgi:hypothetical protein
MSSDRLRFYSRQQALADGELLDVSAAARRSAIPVPVAVTRAVWATCLLRADPSAEAACLAHLLWHLRVALLASPRRVVDFRLPDGTRLKAARGRDDDGAEALTVLLAGEPLAGPR